MSGWRGRACPEQPPTTGWVTLLLVRARSRGLCDGTWFLAPAAPLAGAIGLVVLMPGAPAPFARLLWGLAAAACSVGVVGYLLVVVLALLGVRRHGTAGAPPVCWWVGTGCGGLAAAAIGHVLESRWSAVLVWGIACLVLVPILVIGARHLIRCRFRCTAVVWPPTFSMGVFALGAGQVARLLGSGALTGVFHVAAASTVVFWVVTTWLALWVRIRPSTAPAAAR